jgi:hypothetical protein
MFESAHVDPDARAEGSYEDRLDPARQTGVALLQVATTMRSDVGSLTATAVRDDMFFMSDASHHSALRLCAVITRGIF